MSDKLLAVITPAKNEASNVPEIVYSMAQQSRKPDVWIFVDDQSSDNCAALFVGEFKKYPTLADSCKCIIVTTQFIQAEYALGTKYSSVVKFGFDTLWEYETRTSKQIHFIGILDCDVFPSPDYYAKVCQKLNENPKLGIASGGTQIERNGDSQKAIHLPRTHAAGMMRVWKRECLLQTGYFPSISQDSVSEARAIMMGWKSRSYRDISAGMRPMGGRVKYSYYGKSAYIRWVPTMNIFLHCLKLLMQGKRQHSKEYLSGYFSAKRDNEPHIDDPLVKRYFRYRILYRLIGR